MTETEIEFIALTCVAAACSDGHLDPSERQRIQRLVEEMGYGGKDLFRTAFLKPVSPETIAEALTTAEARRTAYHLAATVCRADDALNEPEEVFLEELREALGISEAAATGMRLEAEYYVDPGLPPISTGEHSAGGGDLDQTILRYAILAGAAELLPQATASVVILPLQLKLVYEIGRRHGVRLDRSQIAELVATFGLGATSQAVETIARRLAGGIAKRVGGRLLGGVLRGATGAVVGTMASFATTYAMGHAASTYYAKGRTLSKADLKELFDRFQADAKKIYPQVEKEIKLQAENLDAKGLLEKVRGLA